MIDRGMEPLPIAVLISGGGTTLRNLIDYQQSGRLDVDFRCVVSSKMSALGLEHARRANIPTEIISRKQFPTGKTHSDAMFRSLRNYGAKLVVMAGYLELLLVPEDFQNRVINIHPSLIPAFSGKGFFGMRVHQAAVDYGVKVSGCTVHFVDNEFDRGPIIAQRTCTVDATDSAQSLQARVFALECELLPQVLQAIAENRVSVHERQVSIDGPLSATD